MRWYDPVTGFDFPSSCRRLRCPVCIVREARRWSAAEAYAQPTQHVVLTLAGNSWAETQKMVNRFRQRLRRVGINHEDAFHVELNASGVRHVHMWRHGDSLSQQQAESAASAAGFGAIVYVSRVWAYDSGVPVHYLPYAVKVPLSQPTTMTTLASHVDAYLKANGRRLGHATRGFWRHGAGGEHIAGVRNAMSQARAARYAEVDDGAESRYWYDEQLAAELKAELVAEWEREAMGR